MNPRGDGGGNQHGQTAPYGSWRSPITATLIAAETVRLSELAFGEGELYWLEQRPQEGGRTVLVRRKKNGRSVDLTPAPYNVRSRVHEYGGGSWTMHEGVIYFSNFSDQRIYRHKPGEEPRPITPSANLRYADGVIDPVRNRLICIREDHTVAGKEAVNALVSLDPTGERGARILSANSDFYAYPRLSPDGSRLAWISWNHPNMPWDGTELWIAEFDEKGFLNEPVKVAGGKAESILQPEWSPYGVLHFISDRSGWWNLYRWEKGEAEKLLPLDAEFGRPLWQLGVSTYAFESAGRIVCSYTREGCWHLGTIDPVTLRLKRLETPHTQISNVRARNGRVCYIGSSPTLLDSIVDLDLESGDCRTVFSCGESGLDLSWISPPRTVEFHARDGRTVYGFYYSPCNPDYAAPAGERPPLIVRCHGGPTSQYGNGLNLTVQYWTSRGFAVLDVNYGGSTGYGRAYRERLNGQWGVVDVEDCLAGAHDLVRRGDVDPTRLAITGGSAGGFTTLCALVFHDYFEAGCSYYGVSDLEALVKETHKFESRYLHRLIAPYPQRQDLYRKRSPIFHADRLSCPVVLFQGSEDKIVPSNQAELMADTLRAKKLPVACLTFEGEQHGFRKSETIKRVLDSELYFYSRIFEFELPDPLEPIALEHLEAFLQRRRNERAEDESGEIS